MSNPILKYKFQVTYKDDSVYLQNDEDVSPLDPTKSCFYDINQKEIKSFFLFNEEHTYSVNLEDGHFEVDGVPFFMHEDHTLKNFRIIFFRKHTHNFNMAHQELSHEIVYRLGWQRTDDEGKNYQQVMEIY